MSSPQCECSQCMPAHHVVNQPVVEDEEPVRYQGVRASIYSFKSFLVVLYHLFYTWEYSSLPTTEDFCWDTVREHYREQLGYDDEMGTQYDLPELVLTNTSYGLAADRLGLILDPEMKEYISNRGGARYYLNELSWIGRRPTFNETYESDYILFKDVIKIVDLLNRFKWYMSIPGFRF